MQPSAEVLALTCRWINLSLCVLQLHPGSTVSPFSSLSPPVSLRWPFWTPWCPLTLPAVEPSSPVLQGLPVPPNPQPYPTHNPSAFCLPGRAIAFLLPKPNLCSKFPRSESFPFLPLSHYLSTAPLLPTPPPSTQSPFLTAFGLLASHSPW